MVSGRCQSLTELVSKVCLDNPKITDEELTKIKKEYMDKSIRMVEIQNTYPNTISDTEFVYWASKAFVEMCDTNAGYKGYLPVKASDNCISIWEHGSLIAFIIFSINDAEHIIDICSAYTMFGYRKQGYYAELFEEFKRFRDENLPEYAIHSEILVDNLPRMAPILEKTNREKVSETWSC